LNKYGTFEKNKLKLMVLFVFAVDLTLWKETDGAIDWIMDYIQRKL
jgi:hypothetical protein